MGFHVQLPNSVHRKFYVRSRADSCTSVKRVCALACLSPDAIKSVTGITTESFMTIPTEPISRVIGSGSTGSVRDDLKS